MAEERESKPTTSKGKSTKVNFILLKHILEDDSSDYTDQEEQADENDADQSKEGKNTERKPAKCQDNCGPLGHYPVLFSKRCKSKSCQTKLSAFPLFSVPEDTEWLSDDEDLPKRTRAVEKRRRRRKSSTERKSEKNKDEEILEMVPEKMKNPDGSRKDFQCEHQLKESKNPVILTWIQRKNKLSRKNRREERKEKKAERAALSEEERIKIERFEQSDKKVKEWFKGKRKEARKLWRQNHPKVSPLDMALDEQNDDSPPPPDYKVVKSFKQNQCSSSRSQSVSLSSNSSTKPPKIMDMGYTGKNLDTESAVESPRHIQRPKTAHNLRSTKSKTPARPKTAKATSNTTRESINSKDSNQSSKPMKSLSYDDWLKSKREQNKNSVIDRRRELIDSHLDTVISKLGKQRVENIMSNKKQIDTGLKNFSRSNTKSPSTPKSHPYKWRNSHDGPRPEPQGCDCPEVEHLDTNSPIDCDSKYVSLSPSSQTKEAEEFCKEVSQKCDDLRPSIEKVLDVLDSEMKKCSLVDQIPSQRNATTKASSLISTTNATCNDTVDTNLSLPGTVNPRDPQPRPKSPRPTSARPTSARPTSAQATPSFVDNTRLTRHEAKKKIFHDMDVLGLCHSDENLSNGVAKLPNENLGNTVAKRPGENPGDPVARTPDINENKSTVRTNYFDYGTEVDVPTMSKLHVSGKN